MLAIWLRESLIETLGDPLRSCGLGEWLSGVRLGESVWSPLKELLGVEEDAGVRPMSRL